MNTVEMKSRRRRYYCVFISTYLFSSIILLRYDLILVHFVLLTVIMVPLTVNLCPGNGHNGDEYQYGVFVAYVRTSSWH